VGIVRFRIDGVLHQVYAIPIPVLTAVTSRIKLLARMEIVEKRRPQDGRIKTVAPNEDEIELRISTMPTAFGEKLVMRIFSPDVLVRDFSELGFSVEDRQRWEQLMREPHGVILVTGPTGSGKTTTLYSTLKQLATPEVNVCTVEDPIEMIEPAFNQMQVQPAIGVDFAHGVRTLLRQDPDIIMVGEIRDFETAEIAVKAALTGHLVLSTLHTNDAPSTINRLLNMGIEPFLVSSSVIVIVAQRLLRRICSGCKAPVQVNPQALIDIGFKPEEAETMTVYHGTGCPTCAGTGYKGRVALYEVLPITDRIRDLILQGASTGEIKAAAVEGGMFTLRRSGLEKVKQGQTTIEEVIRVTFAD
jgi:general secretion pathway protein E